MLSQEESDTNQKKLLCILVYLLLQQLIMILHNCFLKSCIFSVKANQTTLTFQYAVYHTCNNKIQAWHTECRKNI